MEAGEPETGMPIGAGSVAVVTGGASGIGRALCAQLAAAGCAVVVADVDGPGAGAVAAELAGADALAATVDVADLDSVGALAATALDRFGHVDLVFNNAGVSTFNLLRDQTIEDWRWVFDVDLWGVVHGVQTFLPILVAQGTPAHIVNTSSMGGVMGALPFIGPYGAAKAAVVSLSETLAAELAMQQLPVGVSVLCPGSTVSNIMESERVRPESFGAEQRTADAEALRRAIKESFTGPTGLPAATVAARTLEGVRERRFWIFPHASERGIVEARVTAMLDAFPAAN
jgi:NAD(P)-dependent dehydrogenase (short-subunit alcohol dehydrogenase family)